MTAFTKSLSGSVTTGGSLGTIEMEPLMFRLLAATADNGIDFLGNTYRSAISTAAPESAAAVGTEIDFWLSQPNPSGFAVEALYLDIRQQGQAAVVDRVTIDPLTPGVYFNLYYSSDPTGPGSSPGTWDNLLWTPVYQQFQLNRLNTYALPEPITAKYVKVEFTQLQARTYDPGQFQLPSTFRKHPKWVLDYFLARFALQELDLLSSAVNITYDALDLAFSYHQGDAVQNPAAPALSTDPTAQLIQFLNQQGTAAGADPATLAKIRILFQPFLNAPGQLGDLSSVLGSYTASVTTDNYSTEIIQTALANTSIVSNLAREPLLVEKGFPVMFFFAPCRHGYRISQARFEKQIGYFAGVKSLVFHRDIYTGARDQDQYNEVLGDGFNVLINDLA